MLKTSGCGKLRTTHVDDEVTIAGWVHRRRDHGNLIFIDLRDRDGIVQVVFNPESAANAHKAAEHLRNEWVVQVVGEVSLRPEGTENSEMATGDFGVVADKIQKNPSICSRWIGSDTTRMNSNSAKEFAQATPTRLRHPNRSQDIYRAR